MRWMIIAGLAALLGGMSCVQSPPPTTQAVQPATTQAATQPAVRYIHSTSTKMGRVVFVCDANGSMTSEFDNLRVELRKAIEGLRPVQYYNVVFFREDAPPLLDNELLFASPENRARMFDYIDKYTPRGVADPASAIKAAFAMHPDLIFFLCNPDDIRDPQGIIDLFKTLNANGKCRVNTLDFKGTQDDAGQAMLRQIAVDSKGTFRYVSEEDLGK